jgi:hypothetical protein
MSWTAEDLWQKAKLYATHAQKEDRGGQLFPLWCTFALEFLARAALARVSPALLADHRNPENIMYAFGLAATGHSLPAATVFRRCQRVVPNFTESEEKQCMALMDRRNEELHSGAPAFLEFPTRQWLAHYYRNCSLLCSFVDRSLADLFGTDEADAAEEMIRALDERIAASLQEALRNAAAFCAGLSEGERATRAAQVLQELDRTHIPNRKTVQCPACGQTAFLTGKTIHEGRPEAVDENIRTEDVVLPTQLQCLNCGLALISHADVHAAGFGGQYSVEVYYDAVEFFNITIGELHEMEYDNE